MAIDRGITRREFLGHSVAAFACASPAARAASAGAPGFYYAYVGTYTPNGGGIYLFRIERATAALMQMQVVDDIRNPSWLAVNPAQTRLYAISEIDNYQGTHDGAVVTYAIDAETLQ